MENKNGWFGGYGGFRIRSVTARGLGRLLLELGFNLITIRKEKERKRTGFAFSAPSVGSFYLEHCIMGISWTVAVCGL